jgi:hypothetical protein
MFPLGEVWTGLPGYKTDNRRSGQDSHGNLLLWAGRKRPRRKLTPDHGFLNAKHQGNHLKYAQNHCM